MPGTSKAISTITEAINDAFSSFHPESIVPDVEDFMAALDQIPEAVRDALKKFADRLDSDLPVHADVAEGIREMVPGLDTAAEAAREANTTFRNRHEQELEQHHNGRPNEAAWNTGKN